MGLDLIINKILSNLYSRNAHLVMAWGNRILRLPYHLFPVKLGAGSMTAHNFDRFLALWFWKSGSYAQNVATFVDKFCLPGMQVVDIGANIGFFTMYLAKAVGENGKVWAFEPEAKNYANLISYYSAM